MAVLSVEKLEARKAVLMVVKRVVLWAVKSDGK